MMVCKSVFLTDGGKVCSGTKIANTEWDFIEQNLDGYSQDEQVTLSNDICVVLEVIADHGQDPYEYMKAPENERDYSNTPFENVMQYVEDLRDVDELQKLLIKTDNELFQRAIRDYLKNLKPPF